jgi:hypothetical protein
VISAFVVMQVGPHPRCHAQSAGGVRCAVSPGAPTATRLAAAPLPTGDATLVERETGTPGHASIDVWDLYTDDGRYFFSQTGAGLSAQVKNMSAGGIQIDNYVWENCEDARRQVIFEPGLVIRQSTLFAGDTDLDPARPATWPRCCGRSAARTTCKAPGGAPPRGLGSSA